MAVTAYEMIGIVIFFKLKAYAAMRAGNYAAVATVAFVLVIFAAAAATAIVIFIFVIAAAIAVAVNLVFKDFEVLIDLLNILLEGFAIVLNAVELVCNVGKDCEHFGNYLSCFFFLVNTESLGKTFYICNLFADCHNIHLALSRPFSF